MIIISSLVWLGTAIILTIVVFKKSKDSKKTNFSMQYYRDFLQIMVRKFCSIC